MPTLVYTLERKPSQAGSAEPRSGADDAVLAIAMSALGLPEIQKQLVRAPDRLQAVVSFPNEDIMARFNLRIERAMSVRGMRIAKILRCDRPGWNLAKAVA